MPESRLKVAVHVAQMRDWLPKAVRVASTGVKPLREEKPISRPNNENDATWATTSARRPFPFVRGSSR
jgi:hypothetical protein